MLKIIPQKLLTTEMLVKRNFKVKLGNNTKPSKIEVINNRSKKHTQTNEQAEKSSGTWGL